MAHEEDCLEDMGHRALLLLLSLWSSVLCTVDTYRPTENDGIRLVGGARRCAGRLEVKEYGEWREEKSANLYNMTSAAEVCRRLDCGPVVSVQKGLSSFRRVQINCSDPDDVRLVGGANSCSGTLEVKLNREWRKVSIIIFAWTLKAAAVICGRLDCGSIVSTSKKVSVSEQPMWVISSSCVESKSTIKECIDRDVLDSSMLKITCSESVRLAEGTNVCSGTLQVKSDQSWSSVCEDDFNQQNAEVVCRELGCGAPSVFKGGLYGATEAPVWMRRFQCGGTESALLDCGSSQSTENSCSSGKAVGLTCSDPDDVRVVGGANSCSGTLEVKHNGEWREVFFYGWTLKAATVICGWLDCGYIVSISEKIYDSLQPAWSISSFCVQSKSTIKECVVLDGRSYSMLKITCSESVRLVEGTNMCSGRLQVKSDQSWSSVCEDDFNQQNAEVVCRELGCGAPSVLQGALYGAVESPVWSKEFQCEGRESALLDCNSTSSARSNCSSGKAAGLTCSDPFYIRLVAENSRCAGKLEMNINRQWRPVLFDGDTRSSAVCLQLGCGSSVSTHETKDTSSMRVRRISSSCVQSGSTLWECVLMEKDLHRFSSLTVICSELLARPNISLSPSADGVFRAEQQGFWVFIGSSFGILCSVEPQYQGGSFQLIFTSSYTEQNYTLPAVNHSALFLFSAANHTHQGNYTCVYHNQVFFHDFSSVSQPLSLAVSASLTKLIIRVTVVLLAVTSSITAICCYFKWKRDRPENCDDDLDGSETEDDMDETAL